MALAPQLGRCGVTGQGKLFAEQRYLAHQRP